MAKKKTTTSRAKSTSSSKAKGRYVDGFVLPFAKKNLALYKRISSKAGKLWLEHGALEYRETYGDDLKVKGVVSFLKLSGAKPNETVAFSWIVYKSKAHRDKVNAKVMADPRMDKIMVGTKKAPIDYTRMAYGGFNIFVNL